jgi:hypothetical protein
VQCLRDLKLFRRLNKSDTFSVLAFLLAAQCGCSSLDANSGKDLTEPVVERPLIFTSLGPDTSKNPDKTELPNKKPISKIKLPDPAASKKPKEIISDNKEAEEPKTRLRTDEMVTKEIDSKENLLGSQFPSGKELRAASWRVRTGWYLTRGRYKDALSAQIAKDSMQEKGHGAEIVVLRSSPNPHVLLVGPFFDKDYAQAETHTLAEPGQSHLVFIGN